MHTPKRKHHCVNSSLLDKMATILADNIPYAFSWMKMIKFQFRFHWIHFLESNWQYTSIGSGNVLVANRQQAVTGNNDASVPWCIYAALGGIKIKFPSLSAPEVIPLTRCTSSCYKSTVGTVNQLWLSLLTFILMVECNITVSPVH